MSEFRLYLDLGIEHILDPRGYDHILFVLALCAVFLFKDWKKILILVTAFTVGHSITLALATLKIISVNVGLIEFLIPVTIFITALVNILRKSDSGSRNKLPLNYIFALFFGLIHGLGFSNYLQAILGKDSSIMIQLLAFNIGIEVGQIVIVLLYLVLAFIVVNILNSSRRDWRIVLSSGIAGISLMMILESGYL